MTTKPATIPFASLPTLGAALEDGTFAGITTRPDGTHCAVILLPAMGEDLTWKAAKAWAVEHGGELPTRPVAALLFANVQPALSPVWHWTADEYNASYAWDCHFGHGLQSCNHKDDERAAVAVRLIPLI